MKTYFTHANLILPHQVLADASLAVEAGMITEINGEMRADATVVDLEGQFLMPGAIDLHCDAMEKAIEPRPNTFFPIDFAIAQIDRQNAMAGITTPFHALSFAAEELGVRNNQMAAEVVRAIHHYHPFGLVDNRVHCRYEITDPSGLPLLLDLLSQEAVHLFSLMDHTPGQGQFKNIQAYQSYLTSTYHKTVAEAQATLERKLNNAVGAKERINTLIKEALKKNVPLASHDDDTPERVETMANLGVALSEFPVNLATAQKAQEKGLATIFGAPNILRGGSQSGSMKASEAISQQVASCLCSDYVPSALLTAVFQLPQLSDLSLPQAVALVTLNPAQALGLHDRGEIAIGKRADLLVIGYNQQLPQVTQTWVAGKQIYHCQYP